MAVASTRRRIGYFILYGFREYFGSGYCDNTHERAERGVYILGSAGELALEAGKYVPAYTRLWHFQLEFLEEPSVGVNTRRVSGGEGVSGILGRFDLEAQQLHDDYGKLGNGRRRSRHLALGVPSALVVGARFKIAVVAPPDQDSEVCRGRLQYKSLLLHTSNIPEKLQDGQYLDIEARDSKLLTRRRTWKCSGGVALAWHSCGGRVR